MTRLDVAHHAMMEDDANNAARLNFYSQLADAELFILLDDEDDQGQIKPRLFELEEGPIVLAFDLEERLSNFAGGPAPYAALPGRVIAAQLAGQGVGLGLNVGDAPSSIILPAEVMDWLAETLGTKPIRVAAVPQGFAFPWGVPPEMTQKLMEKLSSNPGQADAVLLSEVVYEGGRRGHILAVLGAIAGSEAALSGAVSEAIIFSGLDMGEIDVVFLGNDDPRVKTIGDVALRLDLPKLVASPIVDPKVPGMDPRKPPILR